MTAIHFPTDSERSARHERIRQAIAEHPPMPAYYRDLLPYVQDPDIGFDQLSRIIRNDPGVTMNILKMANTTYFCGTGRVDSLQQAFVRLGSRRLFQIVIAHGLASRLAVELVGYGLAPRILLRHSVGVAITSELLARRLEQPTREMLFTAALLHDMGKVVLDPFVAEVRPVFDALLRHTDRPFDDLEREVLGITHPEAGAQLMKRWNFAEELVDIVACHHHPDLAISFQSETMMVHLADTLIYSQGMGDGIDGLRYQVYNDSSKRLGLKSLDVEAVASGALDQLRELEALMT